MPGGLAGAKATGGRKVVGAAKIAAKRPVGSLGKVASFKERGLAYGKGRK